MLIGVKRDKMQCGLVLVVLALVGRLFVSVMECSTTS